MVGAWLFLALIALGGELLTMSFYLVYEALAAVLAAVVSIFVPVVGVQILAFAIFSLLGLTILRPRTVQMLVQATRAPTQFYADMAGRIVTVRQEVTEEHGLVDMGGGEFWTARAAMPGLILRPGSKAQVLYREGVRLIVQPAEPNLLTTVPEPGSEPEPERPPREDAPPADQKE